MPDVSRAYHNCSSHWAHVYCQCTALQGSKVAFQKVDISHLIYTNAGERCKGSQDRTPRGCARGDNILQSCQL